MVSPTEIANMAFAPRAESLNQTNQFYTQLAAQQQAQNNSRKMQEAKLAQDFDKDLLERIAASGTPADEIIINESNDAMNKIAQFGKENPRASRQQKEQYARQVTLPIIAKKQMAKSAFDELKSREALVAKEMPFVDLSQYRKDFAKNFMYDEQGKPRQSFNMAALNDPNLDLSNIDVAERYANESALSPMVQKMYQDRFQPTEGFYQGTDNQGKLIDVKYAATPLQKVKADLSGLELDVNQTSVGDKVYDILPQEKVGILAGDPRYEIAKRKEISRLKTDNQALNDAPIEVVEGIAAAELAKRFGGSEKSIFNVNYDRQKTADLEAYRAQQLALQRRSLSLREQQFAFNKEKVAQQLKEDPYSPKGIYYTITGASKYKDGAPLSQEAEDIVLTKYRTPFEPNVYEVTKDFLSKETKSKINKLPKNEDGRIKTNLVSPFVSMVDLSASTKDGLFMDKQKMKPYKLYSVYDNEGGVEPKMVKVYYTPAVKNKVTGQLDPAMPEGDPMLVKDPKQELLTIGDYFNDTKAQVKEQIITPQIMDEE